MEQEPVNCTPSELCTYLRELEEGYLPTCSSDIYPSVQSSGNHIASKSWQHGRKTGSFPSFRYTMMSRSLTEDHGEAVLTSFLGGFPVRTLAAPAKEQASKESEVPCGHTWQESSVKYCPDKSTWKTHQCLWEEDLPESSVTLPNWGMVTSDGVLWERTTLPRLTSGTGSGSWPTPCVRDYKDTGNNTDYLKLANKGKLAGVVQTYPTPQANEDAAGTPAGNMQKMLGNDPRVRGETQEEWSKGALNPTWVEWLMGWPIGWTSMEPITDLDWRDWETDPADEGEVPRVATGIKHRVGRLKAIGNGQVPQVAALAWQTLTQE